VYLPTEAFLEKLLELRTVKDPVTGCWLWTGNLSKSGYSQHSFRVGTQTYSRRMHIVTYLMYIGDIESEQLHHTCETRRCVNPYHLEDTTAQVNTRLARGWTLDDKGNWSCKRGHLLVGEGIFNTKSGHARCRKCYNLAVSASKRGVSLK